MASLEIENGMFVKAWGNNVFTISREQITDAVFNFEEKNLKDFVTLEGIVLNKIGGARVVDVAFLEMVLCDGNKPTCSPFDLEICLNNLVEQGKISFTLNGEVKKRI